MFLRKLIWIINLLMLAASVIATIVFVIFFLTCEADCDWYRDLVLISVLLIIELVVIYLVRKKFFPVAGIDYK